MSKKGFSTQNVSKNNDNETNRFKAILYLTTQLLCFLIEDIESLKD